VSNETQGQGGPEGNEVPAVFAALQEQLGLKLEPRKVTLQMIVVDSAEKASDIKSPRA
jgi:uncharacterized protein (TIGR03435 family)